MILQFGCCCGNGSELGSPAVQQVGGQVLPLYGGRGIARPFPSLPFPTPTSRRRRRRFITPFAPLSRSDRALDIRFGNTLTDSDMPSETGRVTVEDGKRTYRACLHCRGRKSRCDL